MIFLLLAATAGHAGQLPDCFKNPKATQTELNECAYGHYQKADRQLTVQWRKTAAAAKRLDKASYHDRPAYSHLLKSQRAWLTYRDETCAWVRAGGGSIAPMNFYNCMADLTEVRTRELSLLAMNPNSAEPL